jgi:hypothetical protein
MKFILRNGASITKHIQNITKGRDSKDPMQHQKAFWGKGLWRKHQSHVNPIYRSQNTECDANRSERKDRVEKSRRKQESIEQY